MDVISFSKARESLKATMDKVCDDHNPVIVTRQNQESVVIISHEDYKSIQETMYLMRSPKNAKRLFTSIEQAKSDQIVKKQLINED